MDMGAESAAMIVSINKWMKMSECVGLTNN